MTQKTSVFIFSYNPCYFMKTSYMYATYGSIVYI